MIAVATAETRARWETTVADCTSTPAVEGIEHARYLLSAHSGHGGCEQYLTALAYVSVVCA
ncbi:hypothetical protein [Nocardia pneumoniae]|uniref:hypothetical protein n=1 Tax=Nocardia pneumoniae TaxID=228601 RepID=UPI00031D9D96|nr:hypothetical protein [Nocardia pneumoniae]